MLRILYNLYQWMHRDNLGTSGFYPIPMWLRLYFKRLPKSRQLATLAKLVVGTDLSSMAPNEFGCMEAVSRICNQLFGDPITTGTWSGLQHFLSSSGWMEIGNPIVGCVIIAATGTGNGSVKNGHAGVVIENMVVCSNNSLTGKFDKHTNIWWFIKELQNKGGMKVRYFVPV